MKRLTRLLRLCIFLYLVGGVFPLLFAHKSDQQKEVLFINSINFNLPWAKYVYWQTHDALVGQGIQVKAESLSVPALRTRTEVEGVLARLRQKYAQPPTAIVIIGDPGWMVCRELFDDIWKDVPVVVTNTREYVPATLDILLSHEPLTPKNTVPAPQWREGYNVTTLAQTYYVKETIDLMRRLMPEMKRLAFISDDRYISEMVRNDVESAVHNFFPELQLEQLATTHLSTEMLLDTLRNYDRNTGLIYYSWFESHNKEDNNYLFDHIQEIIYSFVQTPLFLLAAEDLTSNKFAGGYYVTSESFSNALLSVIHRILAGESPANIPSMAGGEPCKVLCYSVLEEYGIPSSLYPKDAMYVNKPQSFLQEHKVKILWISVVLLAVMTAVAYYIQILRSAKWQMEQAKEQAEKAKEQAEQAREQAEEANRLKSNFLANISHEIRTPLNSIVGFSNMLPQVDDKKEMQEYVDIIQLNADLLLRLIEDILDMSKLEAGIFDFEITTFDFNELLREIKQEALPKIKTDKVQFVLDKLPPIECMVTSDRNRLKQVLMHVVKNSIKFTEEGKISLGYYYEDDCLVVNIADTGPGMSPEECEHVFDRFVKYDSFKQGTGLGLSICKMIIEKLGGEIDLHSNPIEGTLVWIEIPFDGDAFREKLYG